MTLSFGTTFTSEFNKFSAVTSVDDFRASIIPFVQFTVNHLLSKTPIIYDEIKNWKVELFNKDRHSLYEHQVIGVQGCIDNVVLADDKHSGYCFMPTSAGKGHILMILAGLAIGNFEVHRTLADSLPNICEEHPELVPIMISLGLIWSKLITKSETCGTHILVHDKEILKQIEADCSELLGSNLASKIQFFTVQAHRNMQRRENLKYVIIDECHWGNATEEETIQSSLIREIKETGGKAFGFTASPYKDRDGKFNRTWSDNKLNSTLDFNYYLDHEILYPVTLQEVNLQNARVGFAEGDEEQDLVEKEQVINFIVDHMGTTLPARGLDGPAICFFSNVIIPDIVETLFKKRPDLEPLVKVLASDSAYFATKCKEMFGNQILATDKDIASLKAGENILLISRQKLLVGLNAPYLRYCFVSPTNSKIIIMQAIGRLMRPAPSVPKKLATLFLTSLSGSKRLSISGKGADPTGGDDNDDTGEGGNDPNGHDEPKTKYTTTSMTLSEAYDLPVPVFYKTAVGFKDFINQARIKDGNSVELLKRKVLDPAELEKIPAISEYAEYSRTRDRVRAQYKLEIRDRDSRIEDGSRLWFCQGKKLLGQEGCERTERQVNLEIHHMHPYTFAELYRKFGGEDGVIAWHANRNNLKYLVSLCSECHDLIHAKHHEEEESA
jgi:hypothetical protein